MNIVLRPLTLEDRDAFLAGLTLFGDMDLDWYTFVWEKGMSYEEHLKILDDQFYGKNLEPGRVSASMLYAFLDGKIVGRSSIRHELTEYLFNIGGNIGYAVATAYRNQGIATEILKQSLIYCKDVLHLKKVLVTCDEDNIGSRKTIEKNGGIFDNHFVSESNAKTRRYWINL